MITKDNYLKNNLIAYIGNKRRLLPFIENAFLNILEEDKNIKTALDLFAGSGSVSRLLKTLNLKVYSNDWEYYSYILNYAHICINEKDVNNMFKHTGGVENTINIINSIKNIDDKDRYISKYYAPLDDNNPDLKNERLFYTQYNATRIDTNTSGVFKAFHCGFGGRNKDALQRILSPISLKELSLYDGINGEVSMLDANEYVLKNKDKYFDLVYLDPPYNQHQYGSNYHLLNTIALWDKPKVNREIYINGKKTDKGGIRKDWVKTKSDYCYKKTAKDAFKNLIDNINASHIVLSYSTDGIIDYDDLISILESKGKLKIVTSEYTKYRGAKRSVINKTKNVEYLFIVDTKKTNKNNKNNNIKYIENIRLKLNNPVDTIKDNLVFENKKEGNIILKLEYTTHIINQEEICQTLKNKSLEYIKLFSEFLNKHIKENNIEALKIYLSHLKNAILINDKKLIKYFSNHILTIYTRLCSKRSNEYIVDITNEILNIISYYKLNDIIYIDKIKKRIVYNISHSEISEENKNNILVKL